MWPSLEALVENIGAKHLFDHATHMIPSLCDNDNIRNLSYSE